MSADMLALCPAEDGSKTRKRGPMAKSDKRRRRAADKMFQRNMQSYHKGSLDVNVAGEEFIRTYEATNNNKVILEFLGIKKLDAT